MDDLRFQISDLRSEATSNRRVNASARRAVALVRRVVSASSSLRVSASPRLRVFFALSLVACCSFFAGCRQDMQDQPKYKPLRASTFFADGQSSRPFVAGTIPRGHLNDDKFFYQGKQDATQAAGAGATGQNSGGATQSVLQTAAPNVPGAGGVAPGGDINTRGNSGGNVGLHAGETQSQAAKDVVNAFPFPVTKDVLDRGQERYQIFCSECHGLTGYGDGMIVRRGFRRPPSYHDDRLRAEPVGHYFDVITNGWGAMPDYAAQIPPEDRWAIIAYIRALQLSQQGTASQGAATNSNGQTQGTGGTRP